jgi:hypothetical protein
VKHLKTSSAFGPARLGCIFVIWFWLAWSGAAWAQLSIAPTTLQSVEPGGVAIVVFALRNTGSNNLRLEFELKTPKWISVLSALTTRVLAAGQDSLLPVTLALDSDAPAGRNTLVLIARDRGRNPPLEVSTEFSLEVQESRGLKLIASEVSSGGRLGFLLVNQGNTNETIGVTLELAAPNKASPNSFEAVSLEPGGSKVYSAELNVFSPGYLVIRARAVSGVSKSFLMRLKPGADTPAAPFDLRGQLSINGFTPLGANLSFTGLLSDYLQLQFQSSITGLAATPGSGFASLELTGSSGATGFARNWRGLDFKLGFLNDDLLDTGLRADGWGVGAIVAPFGPGLMFGGTLAASGTGFGVGYRFSSSSALMLGLGFGSTGLGLSASFVSSENPAFFTRILWDAKKGLNLNLNAGLSFPEYTLNAALVWDSSSFDLKFGYETLSGTGRFKAEAEYNHTPANQLGAQNFDRIQYSVQYRSDLLFELNGSFGNSASAVLGAGWFGHLSDWNFSARAAFDVFNAVPSLELGLSGKLFTGFSVSFSTLVSSRDLGLTFGINLNFENLNATFKTLYQSSAGISAFGANLALEYNLELLSFKLKAAIGAESGNTQTSISLEAIYRFALPVPEGITSLAGGRREVSVSGRAYLDLNSNGLNDPNEPALVGFTVSLGETQTLTDQNGHYTIRVSIPNERASLNLSLNPSENQTPDAPSIVPINKKLELQAGSRLELDLATLPAASLRLKVVFQAQENSTQDAPSLRVSLILEPETNGATNSAQAIISSDETGVGLAKGLAPETYRLRLIAVTSGVIVTLSSDLIELKAGKESQVDVTLKFPEVEDTSNNLSPRIELETNDPLPPGAEPNLRVSVDGDADTVTLIYPDGTQQNLETVGPENFVTKILIPTFSNSNVPALYTVTVRVTRGSEMVTREINIPIDASVPLCSLQLEPVVAKPGDKVKVNLRCLFRPEQASLSANNFGLELTVDRLFPYQFANEFIVPNTWTGRIPLTVQAKSKRVMAQFSSVLIVR